MRTEAKSEFINNDFTIECNDIILREYRIQDLDELYSLTHNLK
jgi:hypothetical protein